MSGLRSSTTYWVELMMGLPATMFAIEGQDQVSGGVGGAGKHASTASALVNVPSFRDIDIDVKEDPH
jgi:hypothetical protein